MHMVVPEVERERLYQKVTNLIIKPINDNIFPSGSFLSPKRELTKQPDVSRVLLKGASIVLEISGWIIIQSDNGVIVTDKKHSTSDYTVKEILYSRKLADSRCIRPIAQAGKDELINQLGTPHLSMERAISENNVHGFYSLDKLFHLTASEASQGHVLLNMLRILWEQRVNIPYAGLDRRSSNRGVLTSMNQQRRVIVSAIRQADADGAYQKSLEHLIHVRQVVGL